ncbi:hypothetical protein LguiA_007112 [Lonicera macranthoides]
MSSNSSSNSGSCSYATCFCGEVAAMRVSRTEKNPGRRFIGCKNFGNNGCNFFHWVDKERTVAEGIQANYSKTKGMYRENEDWRAVVEGVKELNAHLSKRMESEREKREEVQKKYEQCKKALNIARNRMYLLIVLLLFSVLCNLFY